MQTSSESASPESVSPERASPEPVSPGSTNPAASSDDSAAGDPRSQELAANLAAVHARIDRATDAAGRQDRPQLIVVTKFFPADDVVRLYRLGVRHVGENRDQEAAAKAAEVAQLLGDASGAAGTPGSAQQALHWHFIGQLQSNKARSVISYADHLHSLDRASLLKALVKAAPAQDQQPLTCLIQVDLRDSVPADGRGGADPASIPELAAGIDSAPGLALGGLMAVAPLDEPAAPAFHRLAQLSAGLQDSYPHAAMISAGMSGDLEEAVAHGATHLRVGRDVLGERPLER